jgi:hypothetical protein
MEECFSTPDLKTTGDQNSFFPSVCVLTNRKDFMDCEDTVHGRSSDKLKMSINHFSID